jgi:hypothetical protein
VILEADGDQAMCTPSYTLDFGSSADVWQVRGRGERIKIKEKERRKRKGKRIKLK